MLVFCLPFSPSRVIIPPPLRDSPCLRGRKWVIMLNSLCLPKLGLLSLPASVPFSLFRFTKAPSLGICCPYPPSFGIEVVDSVAYALAGTEGESHIGQCDRSLGGFHTYGLATEIAEGIIVGEFYLGTLAEECLRHAPEGAVGLASDGIVLACYILGGALIVIGRIW